VVHLEGEAAVAGAEVDTTATDNGDVSTQADQLEAAENNLYPDDKPEPELPQAKEEGESEDQEEDQDEDDEEDDSEPSVVPASLTAEEREKFKQLPQDAQDFVASTIKRREEAAQQGVAKAVETQRQAERQAADQVAETKQVHAKQLAAVVSVFAPQPPPKELLHTDPNRYHFLKAAHEEQAKDYGELISQIQGIQGEADQHSQQQHQEWVQQRAQTLMADPDFAQAEDKETFVSSIIDFGVKELGYVADGLVKNAEAQDLINIRRAMRWKEKADKWDTHRKKRNQRPREAQGRFVGAAPAGGRAPVSQQRSSDPLKSLYPND